MPWQGCSAGNAMRRVIDTESQSLRRRTTFVGSLAVVAWVWSSTAVLSQGMTLPGRFAVSPMGAATYTIPIGVSPGVAGLAPSLQLTYSSHASNGILGWGWSLSGLPTIGR